MKITLVQTTVLPTKEENMLHIEALMSTKLDTDMIVLGEMCLSPYENDKFKRNAISQGDEYFIRFQEIARKQQAYLIAGSVPEMDSSLLYNTSFVFGLDGTLITKYRKIHLFQITYPNGKNYLESDTITAGKEIIAFDSKFGRIGVMICFDVRFPRLAESLRKQNVKCIVTPAAFNTYTGPHHWELAFRSRAVDNQLFMIGVSPSGKSAGSYEYYGHSIIVNPFGEILYQASMNEEEITTIDMDLNEVEKIRKAFPIVSNEKVL